MTYISHQHFTLRTILLRLFTLILAGVLVLSMAVSPLWVAATEEEGTTAEPDTFTPAAATPIYLPIIIRSPNDFATRLVAQTNVYRSQHGCPALVMNDQLNDAAQQHSEDMAKNDFFGHIGSNGSQVWDRVRTTGYQFVNAAENVAAGQDTPEQLVDFWYNQTPPNDGHRENMLNCAFREVGVGYYLLDDDTGSVNFQSYWTQVFGVR